MSEENGAVWQGAERRTQGVLDKFHTLLSEHTQDEMGRYQKIINDVEAVKTDIRTLTNKTDDNDVNSESRHDETQNRLNHLTQSIENFMSEQTLFTDAVRRAFPKDDDGKPDYDGHRSAHLSWISDSKEQKEFKHFLKRTMTGAIAVALLSWLWAVVWPAFLQGPKG